MTFENIKLTEKEVNSFSYANAMFSSEEGSRTDKPCLKQSQLMALDDL